MNTLRTLPLATGVATAVLLLALYFYDPPVFGYWNLFLAHDVLRCAGALVLLAGLLAVFVRHQAPALLAAAVFLYLAGGLGLAQSAAALLLLVGCLLLGRRLLAVMLPGQSCSATSAIVCGLAAYLAVLGLLIHFPLNYRTVYFALLCAPLALEAVMGRMPALFHELGAAAKQHGAAAAQIPFWIFSVGAISFTLLARYAFLPTLGFDDNALHLGLWSQLSHRRMYGFDYLTQVWEVSPFAVDLLHATVNLVAGADARGATNLLLLALLLRQLWVILATLQLGVTKRVLVLLLFLSTPMTAYLLLTLQTDLFLALLAATGVRLILELRHWCSAQSAALLALAALACATKLPGAELGVAVLAAAALRLWSLRASAERPTLRALLMLGAFIGLLATLAFNAYLSAWLKTGNPVFPLYNALFKSPYFETAANFSDARWIQGFSLSSYWDLFFNTSAYNESANFVAGFQYLLLFPLGLGALLLRPQRQHAASLLLPLFGYGLVMFAATQYWRYQFAVLPLASVVIGALLIPQYTRRGALVVRAALLCCMALNISFYPGLSTFLQVPPGNAYTAAGKQQLIENYTPARALTAWVNANAPGSTVLYPEDIPYGATLNGKPLYTNWYSPANEAAFKALRNETEGLKFLRDNAVAYVLLYQSDGSLPGSRPWVLRDFMSRIGIPVAQAASGVLYSVAGHDVPYRLAWQAADSAMADRTPRLLAGVDIGGVTIVRYRAEFACTSDSGSFVAQINWDRGEPYYHRVRCTGQSTLFSEAVPVPGGASHGDIYLSVSDTDSALITQLSLETN
ncbi:MAG: hypothetical protein RLZZ227_2554 [Pseudomonadota bacterium]